MSLASSVTTAVDFAAASQALSSSRLISNTFGRYCVLGWVDAGKAPKFFMLCCKYSCSFGWSSLFSGMFAPVKASTSSKWATFLESRASVIRLNEPDIVACFLPVLHWLCQYIFVFQCDLLLPYVYQLNVSFCGLTWHCRYYKRGGHHLHAACP